LAFRLPAASHSSALSEHGVALKAAGGAGAAAGASASSAAAGSEDDTAVLIRRLLRRLSIYPFLLVVVWFWPTVNRIYESATGGDQVFWLFLLQV
jgi:uncharacterized membrane protein YadS